jgi:hypothetical protein
MLKKNKKLKKNWAPLGFEPAIFGLTRNHATTVKKKNKKLKKKLGASGIRTRDLRVIK